MRFVKVGQHYLNTDLIQFATEEKGVVSVHYAGQMPLRMTAEEWEAVARTMSTSAAEERKLMNPGED